jgi:hypothetical protein
MVLHIRLHKAVVFVVQDQQHRRIIDGKLLGHSIQTHALGAVGGAHDTADTNTASSNTTRPAARHKSADSCHCVATTPPSHTSALALRSVASIIPHDCVTANLAHTLTPGQMYLLGRIPTCHANSVNPGDWLRTVMLAINSTAPARYNTLLPHKILLNTQA